MNKLSIRDLDLTRASASSCAWISTCRSRAARHRRHAHPRNASDAESGARTRREAGAGFAPRAGPKANPIRNTACGPWRRSWRSCSARGRFCRRLRGRGRGSQEPRARERRRPAARKCPLPRGGRGQRRGLLAATGRAVRRPVRVRRVRLGAPRACFGGGHHASSCSRPRRGC